MVVSTREIDCLERLIFKITYYMSTGTLNPTDPLNLLAAELRNLYSELAWCRPIHYLNGVLYVPVSCVDQVKRVQLTWIFSTYFSTTSYFFFSTPTGNFRLTFQLKRLSQSLVFYTVISLFYSLLTPFHLLCYNNVNVVADKKSTQHRCMRLTQNTEIQFMQNNLRTKTKTKIRFSLGL